MVILLIEHLCGHEPGLTDDLSVILEQLTKLNSAEHSRVALRARQVRFFSHTSVAVVMESAPHCWEKLWKSGIYIVAYKCYTILIEVDNCYCTSTWVDPYPISMFSVQVSVMNIIFYCLFFTSVLQHKPWLFPTIIMTHQPGTAPLWYSLSLLPLSLIFSAMLTQYCF